jgi:cell division protein FtsI (penicillin-binding protein 3)
MSNERKQINIRATLMFVFAISFACAIAFKILNIQFREGDHWKSLAKQMNTRIFNIEAARGNIFDCEGNLLVTSVPIYDVEMDVNSDPLTDKIFYDNIDSLSLCLDKFFGNKSQKQFKRELIRSRKSGSHFYFIAKNVTYNELQVMKKFPIFRLGKFKGGFMAIQKNRRELPFQYLAARTLGYDRTSIKPVGVEGAFNKDLKGVSGKRLMQKIAGGVWMPLNEDNELEPKDGADIVTTLDINIQDVAHHSLEQQLIKLKAKSGCIVLMEVATGDIKAIVNLTRKDSGDYRESYNYAIGAATEPGSTFKLPALMVAIDDGFAKLDEMVDTENGVHDFYGHKVKDSHGGIGYVTLQEVFEKSSNVGTSKIVNKYYSKHPQKFVDGLYRMGLHTKLNLDIPGEAAPYIKMANDKLWSMPSLPVMSTGYEVKLSPLQILTFYNAVANNGVMVKPHFVREIREKNIVVKKFEPEVLVERIAKPETILKARKLLEGVVERGTAKYLKTADYKIAAKTGTAQILLSNGTYGLEGQRKYQGSLCGFFPAANPKYSMIVVISEPSNGEYYANEVAGPVFRDVADKVYSTSTEIHKKIDADTTKDVVKIPFAKAGATEDLEFIGHALKLPFLKVQNCDWANTTTNTKSVLLNERKMEESKVPNVVGMGLKDAMFLLENAGLNVKFFGAGKVQKQSITQGASIKKGNVITIVLG